MGYVGGLWQGWGARRRPDGRGVALGWAGLGALAVGLLLVGCGGRAGAGATDPAVLGPRSASRSEVVVRGHTQLVAGTLTGGARVSGTLYPALPGVSMLHLWVTNPGGRGGGVTGRLEVAASMPGMAMPPATATLVERVGDYQGTIALPMFGRYVARIIVVTRRGRRHGAVTLDVPLALGT